MDISKDGTYLAIGFADGKIVIWNLLYGSISSTITDAHTCNVLSLCFLRGKKMGIISSDTNGYVFLTRFAPAILGLSSTSYLLLKNRIIFTLASLQESSLKENFIGQASLVAIGGVDSVLVSSLESSPKILWEFKRKASIKKSIPSIDWGKGSLNNKGESSILLAIGWDTVIQVIEIYSSEIEIEGYEFNGHYESKYEIQAISWITENVLLILNANNKIQLLHIENFVPGEYNSFSEVPANQSSIPPELEAAYRPSEDIVAQLHNVNLMSQLMKSSCQQTFKGRGREITALTVQGVIHGELLTWREYINSKRGRAQWIELLQVALELYRGNLRGFGEYPSDKSIRENAIRNLMQNLIYESIAQQFEDKSEEGVKANIIQMEVTIEFFIEIAAGDYLFTDLLKLFDKYKLEEYYIDSLEFYILDGKLKSFTIPHSLLKRLIEYYKRRGKVDVLERVISSINLKGQDLEYLSNICITSKMFSAMMYVKNLKGNVHYYIDPILYMHNEMKTHSATEINSKYCFKSGDNKSYGYMGYKILWYIKKCFKRENFPLKSNDNCISLSDWPKVVYILLKWIIGETERVSNIEEFIRLDAKTVFGVLKLLFEDDNLRSFITEPEKYQSEEFSGVTYRELLEKVSEIVGNNKQAADHYYLFLAQISFQPKILISPEICATTAVYLMNSKEFTKDAIESLILKMLKNIKDLKDSLIRIIVDTAKSTNYTEIEVYLAELKGDYFKCFDIYFNLNDWKRAEKIFDWLNHIRDNIGEGTSSHVLVQRLILKQFEKMVFD